MKILLTGAHGLLGGCLRDACRDLDVTGTYHSRPADDLVQLNIENPDAVDCIIDTGNFTHIINCAALRSPDYCIDHPEESYHVNALAVEYLARAATRNDATLIQISTDYVFSGTEPPYSEEDLPAPVNLYGRTKLAGEHAARQTPKHVIVRIPALWRTDMDDSRNAASVFYKWIANGETRSLDSETVRYYTLADDIARAIRFLMDTEYEGLIHLTAEQKTSKADFARRLAESRGHRPAQVQDGPIPSSGDIRPYDSHLDASRYRSLKGPALRSVDEILGDL